MATITLGAIITNNEGIHARTAAALLRVIKQYNVEVFIKYKDNIVNLKHLIDVIALSISCDAYIELIIEGEDAISCSAELSKVIKSDLGEIS